MLKKGNDSNLRNGEMRFAKTIVLIMGLLVFVNVVVSVQMMLYKPIYMLAC